MGIRIEYLIKKHNQVTNPCDFYYPKNSKESNNLDDYEKITECIVVENGIRKKKKIIGYVEGNSSSNDTSQRNNPLSDFFFFLLGTYFIVNRNKSKDYDNLVINQGGVFYKINKASTNTYHGSTSGECQKKHFSNLINQSNYTQGEENTTAQEKEPNSFILHIPGSFIFLDNDKNININDIDYNFKAGVYNKDLILNKFNNLQNGINVESWLYSRDDGENDLYIKIKNATIDNNKSTLIHRDNDKERNTMVYLKENE